MGLNWIIKQDNRFKCNFRGKGISWLDGMKDLANDCYGDPNNDNINDFIAKHYNFDLVITARFHGAVFASLIGKPFITIGIEPKLEMISIWFDREFLGFGYIFYVLVVFVICILYLI